MIISYCIVIAIPLLFAFLLYPILVNSYAQNTFSQNSSMLSVCAKEQDSMMQRLNFTMEYLLLHPDISNLSRDEKYQLGQTEYEEYIAFSDLNKTGSGLNTKDIVVYYPFSNRVISLKGAMNFPLYYNLMLKSSNYTEEQVTRYLQKFHSKEFIDLDDDTLLYISSDPKSMGIAPSYQIGLMLNRSSLTAIVRQIGWDDQISMVITDRKGFVVDSFGKQNDISLFDTTLCNGTTHTVGKGQDKKVLIYQESTFWKYYETIPYSIYRKDARHILLFFTLGLLISIIAVFTLATYFTRKNYVPIKRVMHVLGGAENETIGDEYQWVENKAKQILDEKTMVQRQIDSEKESVRRYYIANLLDHMYDVEEDSSDKPILFSGQFFTVAIVTFFDSPKHKAPLVLTDKQLQTHEQTFSDIMEKESSDKGINCYFLTMNGRIVILCNTEKQSLGIITLMLEEAQEQFQTNTTILIGDEHQGKEGIFASYQEALGLFNYQYLLDDDLICYDDIKDKKGTFFLGPEQEQKLLNAVSAGDKENARSIVQELFKLLSGTTPYIYNYSMFTILGYLSNIAEKNGIHDFFEQVPEAKTFSIDTPLEETEQKFLRTIDALIAVIRQKKGDDGSSFINKVEAYIDAHYQDYNLNISSIAYHFSISSSYLSTLYRKEKGYSPLERINQLRIEKSIKLLQGSDSIAHIATIVGFNDSNSFIRVFKKIKGITPGQMRNLTSQD